MPVAGSGGRPREDGEALRSRPNESPRAHQRPRAINFGGTGEATDAQGPPAFVLDNGSGVIKAALGSKRKPRLYHAYVGRPKYARVMAGTRQSTIFAGRRCRELRGVLRLEYPTTSGIVSDWDAMERLWRAVYGDQGVDANRHRVLVTEPPLGLLENRRRTAEIFLEVFRAPSICFQTPHMLGLFASGRTTGLVIDSGDTQTSAVPLYEGKFDPCTVRRIPIGGRHVTQYLRKLLRRDAHNFVSTSELEVVKNIKEKMCFTAEVACATAWGTGADHRKRARNDATVGRDPSTGCEWKLPDGRKLWIGSGARIAPELLFQPTLMGFRSRPVHEMAVDAVQSCEVEQRRAIYKYTRLLGGNTLSKGFSKRLAHEIATLLGGLSASSSVDSSVIPLSRRLISNLPLENVHWTGGALLSEMSSIFPDMSVTRAQLAEYGDQILFRKRP